MKINKINILKFCSYIVGISLWFILFPAKTDALIINDSLIPPYRKVHNRTSITANDPRDVPEAEDEPYSYRWKWCSYSTAGSDSTHSAAGGITWGSRRDEPLTNRWTIDPPFPSTIEVQTNNVGHHCAINMRPPIDPNQLSDGFPNYVPRDDEYAASSLIEPKPILYSHVNLIGGDRIFIDGVEDFTTLRVTNVRANGVSGSSSYTMDFNDPQASQNFYVLNWDNNKPHKATYDIEGIDRIKDVYGPGIHEISTRIKTRPVVQHNGIPPGHSGPYACATNGDEANGPGGQLIGGSGYCQTIEAAAIFYIEIPEDTPTGYIDCGNGGIDWIGVTPTFNPVPLPSGYNMYLKYRREERPYNTPNVTPWEEYGSNVNGSNGSPVNVTGLTDTSEYRFRLAYTDASGDGVRHEIDGSDITCITQAPAGGGTTVAYASCPTLSNSLKNVTLTNAAPDNAGLPDDSDTGRAGRTTTNSAGTHTQVIRKGIEIKGTEDISVDNTFDVDVVTASSQIGTTKSSNATFNPSIQSAGSYHLKFYNFAQSSIAGDAAVDLDYRPFIEQCPYDRSQGQVEYRSYYDQQKWKASTSVDHNTCDSTYDRTNDGDNNGVFTTCYDDYGGSPSCSTSHGTPPHCYTTSTSTINATKSCPSGYSDTGSTCRRSVSGRRSLTGFCVAGGSPANCTTTQSTGYNYSCPSGYSGPSGSPPQCTRTNHNDGANVSWSCNSGDGNAYDNSDTDSLSNNCTHTFNSTNHYLWIVNGAYETDKYESSEKNADEMQPCYNRTYTAEAIATSASLNPDRESPTSTSFTSNIRVDFGTFVPTSGSFLFPKLHKTDGTIVELPSFPGSLRSGMRKASSINDIPFITHFRKAGVASWSSPTSQSPPPIGTAAIDITTSNKNRIVNDVNSSNITASGPVARPPLVAGDKIEWELQSGSTSVGVTGQMDIDGVEQSSSNTAAASRFTNTVVNWPYFKVYGGDIVNGGSFGGACNFGGQQVRSFYRPGQYTGSSAQFAIFALGAIEGVTSGSLKNTAEPNVGPFGLTYANTTGGYGGYYTANDAMTCQPDYYALKPSNATSITGDNIDDQLIAANSNPDRIQYYDVGAGTVTLGGVPTISVNDSVRKVFYIDGTLQITSDIVYTNAIAGWADRSSVPFAMFVARDIVIAPGVTQIDGIYVAQNGNGGSGTIDTCAVALNSVYGSCGSQLVINGALMANEVEFKRARGSLRDSQVNEGRGGVGMPNCSYGNKSAVGTPGGESCAGEIISFTAEAYMVLSQIVMPNEGFRYDRYVVLPPNL